MAPRRRTRRALVVRVLVVVLVALVNGLLVGSVVGLVSGWDAGRGAVGFVFLLSLLTLPLHVILRRRIERYAASRGLGRG